MAFDLDNDSVCTFEILAVVTLLSLVIISDILPGIDEQLLTFFLVTIEIIILLFDVRQYVVW